MPTEIERKFLVTNDAWRDGAEGERYRQGYLTPGPPAAVRVRIAGSKAFLNIKEATTRIHRQEFEYEIPLDHAHALLDRLCAGHVIEKTRYRVPYGGRIWEIDVFEGVNEGLVVAEVELDDENAAVDLPPWVGEEVSSDIRYFNSSLALHPYQEWKERR